MEELHKLIATGESGHLEFKKTISSPEKIARTLVAFANTQGGTILVGVLDNGQLTTIDPEEEKYTLQLAADLYCNPAVRVFYEEIEEEDLVILRVTIPESKIKPHLAKITEADWRGYIRVKDETVQTSKLVLEALKTEEPAITPVLLNKLESTLLSYLKDQPRITLKQYMHLVNISQRRASRILLNLVLQGFIQMHDQEKEHYYTLS